MLTKPTHSPLWGRQTPGWPLCDLGPCGSWLLLSCSYSTPFLLGSMSLGEPQEEDTIPGPPTLDKLQKAASALPTQVTDLQADQPFSDPSLDVAV